MNRKNIESKIKITPKSTFLHFRCEVAVGRCYNPYIYFPDALAAESFDLPFLQGTQQFGL